MATFDLKKQLTIHDRGLLRQLLGKEPSMQGIDWGAMPRNNIDPLIAAWEELEDAQKRHYQVVLQDVQHLADPKGQRVLIEELEWRHPGSLAKFAALLSPSDKALWAFLKARDAFDSAAIFARAELLRNGQQANIWNSLPKKPIAITDDKLSLFEHQIRSYYWTREMRGELCKVHQLKSRDLFTAKDLSDDPDYVWLMGPDHQIVRDRADENLASDEWRRFRHQIFLAAGRTPFCVYPLELNNKTYQPTAGRSWSTNPEGAKRLIHAGRLIPRGSTVNYVRFADDFPVNPINNIWMDAVSSSAMGKVYVVQTNVRMVERCMLLSTDPGDLVLDPTCGSGTTAFAAEQWGRRWITCDTSRVAITLAKQRLMTAVFDYYTLAHPKQGVGSGFKYKTVPHVTLKSIANNPEIIEDMSREEIDAAIKKYADQEVLYDQPEVDRSKARVTGPFTYEAVPAINVREIDDPSGHGPVAEPMPADGSISRSGVTSRQDEWRDELARTGVRGKGGTKLEFLRLEPLPGTRYLHAIGDTKDRQARTVAVSFGPEHAPLEQRHVELAWEEARGLKPKPEVLLFAAFHFDPEAAKDIDELDPQKAGMQLLKLQMNTDLLTDDLKKKRSSNESFWLVGQPDVTLRKIHRGQDSGLWEVEVHGFDYYNPSNGKIESGDTSRIAMWLLDTDYDGRSLLPRQVFFPMSGEKDGWSRLSKNLKAEIDEDLIEAYRGTISLPFDLGKNRRIAAKIIDDRGIECLKIINMER